jgi:hypothetical protein
MDRLKKVGVFDAVLILAGVVLLALPNGGHFDAKSEAIIRIVGGFSILYAVFTFFSTHNEFAKKLGASEIKEPAAETQNNKANSTQIHVLTPVQLICPPAQYVPIPETHIRYFITYSFTSNCMSGFGSSEFGRSQTIRGSEDIKEMCAELADSLIKRGYPNASVVIINWQRFEAPREDDGGRETTDNDMSSIVDIRLVA